MNTYTCPICGKTYTSAIAMANCVAECAKEEDYERALDSADKSLVFAKEQLEKAVEEYNSVSKDLEYSFTINKRFKKGAAIGGITRTNPSPSAVEKVKESDLEAFLKDICNIDSKPSEVKPDLAIDKKAEDLFNKFNDFAKKCADESKKTGGDGDLAEFLTQFEELKKSYYNSKTLEEKQEKVESMEAAINFLELLMIFGGMA